MGPVSTDFNKFFFKTGSHGTIHTFKNHFATVFSVFNNKWYPKHTLKTIWSLGTKGKAEARDWVKQCTCRGNENEQSQRNWITMKQCNMDAIKENLIANPTVQT